MKIDLLPFWITLKLAVITSITLFILCFPLSIIINKIKSKLKNIFISLITLPIVLPPTVLGFYLLLFFSPNFFFGIFLEHTLNIRLVFSFEGMVIASCIYSLPFMIQPLLNGLNKIDNAVIEASYTLGKSKFETLIFIVIPKIKNNIITAVIMTIAHTLGEFGVVLMIGGNIPGLTKVASIAIYDKVEELDYISAHIYSLILIIISFIIILSVNFLNSSNNKPGKIYA